MGEFRYSRRTVIAALDVLDGLTQPKLSRFLLELGPDLPLQVRDEGASVPKRLNDLMDNVHAFPNHRLDDGNLLRDALVEKAISLLPPPREPVPWDIDDRVPPSAASLLRWLELDGFKLSEGGLQRTLPAEFKVPEAESELSALLKKHGLPVPTGHLEQALTAHGRGDWAAANAMLRSFFDALLDEITEKLDPSAAALDSGQSRRAKLASLGFLSRDLNEWDDDGRAFINGLVRRLHPHGAHPGLSDEEDSAYRVHIVLLTARLLLVRFDRQVTR